MAIMRSGMSSILPGFTSEPAPAGRRRSVLARARTLAAERLERRDLLAIFAQIEGITGEATDSTHTKWILADSANVVFRSTPGGGVDQRREASEPSLSDVTIIKIIDGSSPKLFPAASLGRIKGDVLLDFTVPVGGREVPYLQYTFHHVRFSSYSVRAEASNPAKTAETLSLTYKTAEWRSFQVNPITGEQTNEVRGVHAPPTVGLSSTSVAEKRPAGTVVGRLSTPYGFTNETYTYKLVAGKGSQDNAAFKIVGDEVQTRFPLNTSARKSYSIRVQSKSTDGSVVEKTFTIRVVKAAAAARQRAFVVHG